MKEEEIYKMLTDSASQDSAHDHEQEDPLPEELRQRFSDSSFLGDIPTPDGYAYVRADCGDALEVFLSVRDQQIQKARFDTLGCGFTVACGSMAMEMAEGRTLAEAMGISPNQIVEALKGLPASHEHCAELAALTLKKAIEDYMMRSKEPWKKLYRNR